MQMVYAEYKNQICLEIGLQTKKFYMQMHNFAEDPRGPKSKVGQNGPKKKSYYANGIR